MKINFEEYFRRFAEHIAGTQKKVPINTPVGVYYGLSEDGFLRLSILSRCAGPKMESTKQLAVTQGRESQDVYWTCFDLINKEAEPVFYSFCSNLLGAIEGATNEFDALNKLKIRYIIWKSLFKKEITEKVSIETVQGLFGELFFMKNYLFERFGVSASIRAWSGPEALNKDFALGNNWFEVKTVGVNAASVRISSISQLASNYPGHLAIVRVERMASEFSNGESSILELFENILKNISDETIENIFSSKIASYGIGISDPAFSIKFEFKGLKLYLVKDSFPRLTDENVPYSEITNILYDISIPSIKKFAEE